MTDLPEKPPPDRPRKRLTLGVLLAVIVFATVAGAAYLVGGVATEQGLPDSYPWYWQPTAGPLLSPPPTPFAQVDPAIVEALTHNQGIYSVEPLAVLGDVMPVGAYLPQSGSAPARLGTPLPPPTVAPLPTSPSFQPSEDEGILPTPEPLTSPLGGPPPEPYGGDDCAPRGLPVSGILTQRFHAWHSGVDFGIPVGTAVVATHSGRVIFAGWSTVGYGNLVIIQNGAFITYYAHLSAFNVVDGQVVGAGSLIAYSGNTGNSSGPHIHYEVRINDVPVDPLTFESRGYRWC